MRRVIFATIGLLIFALPQVAVAAPKFSANWRYAAKFVCGEGGGSESRDGVIEGHYNTTINVQSIRNGAMFAYRATPLSSTLGVEWDFPSGFSVRYDRDLDGGVRIVCSDIKRLLDVNGDTGFIEGFVNVYSTKQLNVVSVVTGEGVSDGGNGLSVMQLLNASERKATENIEYQVEE